MVMHRTSYKIVIFTAALLAFSASARAEVPPLQPLNITARYNVAWNGLTIGRINITATEDQFGYRMVVDTKTKGFAKLFSDERTVAQAKGRHGETQPYLPSRYESHPNSEDDTGRTIIMTYDENGHIATRMRNPEDDVSWRAPVPTEQANTATDPITGGFILRRLMHDNMANNKRETTIKTYDGARLAEMHFNVVSRARVEAMGSYTDGINVVVSRTPIAGYTPKEMKKYNKGDPTIHLYFSADAKFLPLKATVGTSFGEVSATLAELK